MITDYAELQTNVIRWLGRTTDPELPPLVPSFIALFESEARRKLTSRVGEIRSVNSTIVAEYTGLPSDFVKARTVRRVAPNPGPLKLVADSVLAGFPDENGTPTHAAIAQRSLRLWPRPTSTIVVQLTYTRLPGLSVSVPSNWLLDLAPDAYLYGALARAGEHYGDERAEGWLAKSLVLLQDINDASAPMRSSADLEPVVTGSVV